MALKTLSYLKCRDYWNAGVCVFVFVCQYDNIAISHYNFVKYGPIVIFYYIKVTRYNTYIINTYHGNKSKVKVNVIEIVKNIFTSIQM